MRRYAGFNLSAYVCTREAHRVRSAPKGSDLVKGKSPPIHFDWVGRFHSLLRTVYALSSLDALMPAPSGVAWPAQRGPCGGAEFQEGGGKKQAPPCPSTAVHSHAH